MRVNITSTPDYSQEKINEVITLLNKVPSNFQFISCEPLTLAQLKHYNNKFNNPDGVDILTFEELFGLCNLYRIVKSIPDDEFVVVITKIYNTDNWFSSNSDKNIFLHSEGWNYITDEDSKYGIAYQIVENIFQSLSGIDVVNYRTEPNIHHRSIGCINDMCTLKSEAMLKLRTGYICPSCQKRATDNNVSPLTLHYIISIIRTIRDDLMDFNKIITDLEPPKLIIHPKGKITIGNIEIDLQPIQKVLFIFFLIHIPEGIRHNEGMQKINPLNNFKQELLDIYRKIRKAGEEEVIDNLIVEDISVSTFNKVKSELAKRLIEQIGIKLSEFYVINLVKVKDENYSVYKIKLLPDCLHIDPRF